MSPLLCFLTIIPEDQSHTHNMFYTDTESTCTSPPPTMRHADMTYNATHVNYTCHAGAAFFDETTFKTYTCSCASFEVNQPCISTSILLFLPLYTY